MEQDETADSSSQKDAAIEQIDDMIFYTLMEQVAQAGTSNKEFANRYANEHIKTVEARVEEQNNVADDISVDAAARLAIKNGYGDMFYSITPRQDLASQKNNIERLSEAPEVSSKWKEQLEEWKKANSSQYRHALKQMGPVVPRFMYLHFLESA